MGWYIEAPAPLSSYAMMLGQFEWDIFHDSPDPHLALVLFFFFMLAVTIVMLNAVIAIMVTSLLFRALARLDAVACRGKRSARCTK